MDYLGSKSLGDTLSISVQFGGTATGSVTYLIQDEDSETSIATGTLTENGTTDGLYEGTKVLSAVNGFAVDKHYVLIATGTVSAVVERHYQSFMVGPGPTGTDIETEARRILHDDQGERNWGPEIILAYIKDGLTACKNRADWRIKSDGTFRDVTAPTVVSDALDIHANAKTALVYYVVGRCYGDDSAETANAQLAELYNKKFLEALYS